jgi:two-component system, CitB family, sensor kinase
MRSRTGIFKQRTLRKKINGFVVLIVGIILILVMSVMSYSIASIKFQDVKNEAFALSQTISTMKEIQDAFTQKDPSSVIQPIAETLRQQTGAQFIVVSNMETVRYSHPNPTLVGMKMSKDDDQDGTSVVTVTTVTEGVGSLGLSVRSKAPIFNGSHQQIGNVSVGFLESNIWSDIFHFFFRLLLVGGIGLAIGLMGAHLLSGHIKRQIFNMEPYEIASMTLKQEALMQSIREGILAVDQDGIITACNQEAKRLLTVDETSAIVGQPITNVIPNSRLPEILQEGDSHTDQPMIIGNTLVVANRVPILLQGQVIGAVSTFRDKMELDEVSQRLADVGQYADALRSQRHEFMNRLHTISGLIQVGEYEMVRELINQVNEEQQNIIEFFLAHVRDPAVVGILIGKIHHAKELGIQMTVDPTSRLSGPCSHQETVITILGNAIENAIEAVANGFKIDSDGRVCVYINDETDGLQIKVSDTGPGIDPAIGERIFNDGISTKGAGRGFGLALVHRMVLNIGGTISVLSSTTGATLEAKLPK